MHENEEAIKYLKQAEPSAVTYPEVYYALARAYRLLGDRVNGNACMKKFQELSAAQSAKTQKIFSVDRLVVRGQDALSKGNTEEARSLFEQATKADPQRWDAHGFLAEMYLASGDLQDAYIQLTWMQKIYPESMVGNYLMARYWVLKKDYKQALPYAVKAKHIMPGNSELRTLLATIYSHLGEKDKAEQESMAAAHLSEDQTRAREDINQLKTPKTRSSPAPPQH